MSLSGKILIIKISFIILLLITNSKCTTRHTISYRGKKTQKSHTESLNKTPSFSLSESPLSTLINESAKIDKPGTNKKIVSLLNNKTKRYKIIEELKSLPKEMGQQTSKLTKALLKWDGIPSYSFDPRRLFLPNKSNVTASIATGLNQAVANFSENIPNEVSRLMQLGHGIPPSWDFVFRFYPYIIFQDQAKARDLITKMLKFKTSSTKLDTAFIKAYSGTVGPVMRKLMQKMVETMPKGDLKDKLRINLQSSIDPISKKEILQLKKDLYPSIEGANIEVKNLKSASVGQVVKVTRKDAAGAILESFVVKIKRPGIAEKIAADINIFQDLLKGDANLLFEGEKVPIKSPFDDPTTIQMFNDIAKGFREELNFSQERANIIEGEKIYGKRNPLLESIGIIDKDASLSKSLKEKYILMTEAPGESLSAVIENLDKLPKPKQIEVKNALAELRKTWSLEAFTGSGFFHGDPHLGNFHIDLSKSPAKIYVLDYGNAGKMTGELRYSTIMLGAGIGLKSKGKILTATKLALKSGTEIPQRFKDDLKDAIKDRQNFDIRDYSELIKEHGIKLKEENTRAFTALQAIEDWDISYSAKTGDFIGNSFSEVVNKNRRKFVGEAASGFYKQHEGKFSALRHFIYGSATIVGITSALSLLSSFDDSLSLSEDGTKKEKEELVTCKLAVKTKEEKANICISYDKIKLDYKSIKTICSSLAKNLSALISSGSCVSNTKCKISNVVTDIFLTVESNDPQYWLDYIDCVENQ